MNPLQVCLLLFACAMAVWQGPSPMMQAPPYRPPFAVPAPRGWTPLDLQASLYPIPSERLMRELKSRHQKSSHKRRRRRREERRKRAHERFLARKLQPQLDELYVSSADIPLPVEWEMNPIPDDEREMSELKSRHQKSSHKRRRRRREERRKRAHERFLARKLQPQLDELYVSSADIPLPVEWEMDPIPDDEREMSELKSRHQKSSHKRRRRRREERRKRAHERFLARKLQPQLDELYVSSADIPLPVEWEMNPIPDDEREMSELKSRHQKSSHKRRRRRREEHRRRAHERFLARKLQPQLDELYVSSADIPLPVEWEMDPIPDDEREMSELKSRHQKSSHKRRRRRREERRKRAHERFLARKLQPQLDELYVSSADIPLPVEWEMNPIPDDEREMSELKSRHQKSSHKRRRRRREERRRRAHERFLAKYLDA